MTIRFTENDLGTGANNIVALDANGKIPAIDGSLLTNVSGKARNGASFSYIPQSTATFNASVDTFYWLYKADIPTNLNPTLYEESANYTITLPNSNIYTGSKVAFETYARGGILKANSLNATGVNQSNGGSYSITVPSSSGTGYNSFKMILKGQVYTEGQTWSSGGSGRNKMSLLYAYVDGSNNVTWVDFRGGLNTIDDFINFDIGNTYPIVSGRSYQLVGDDTTKVFYNYPLYQHLQITGNTTLAWGTNLNPLAKRILITVNAAATPTITMPASSLSTNYVFIFKVLPNFKNTTLDSIAGRTKQSGFTLLRAGTDVFLYQSGIANQTTYTTFTAPTSTFNATTGCYSNNVYYVIGGPNWAVLRGQTSNTF